MSDSPPVETRFFHFGPEHLPFELSSGESLPEVSLAYETYGALNQAGDNAIVVFHALSGSQHAAGTNPAVPGAEAFWTRDCHEGWWDAFIGPNRALNTDKFCVICVNYIGGCYGSTGPSSLHPETGKPYGGAFPSLSFLDLARSQKRLLDHIGVTRLHALIGASVGGMIALSFATHYPELVEYVALIGSGTSLSSLQRIHNYEQICAIQLDPHFNHGDYYGQASRPEHGLSLARIVAHKTYVSIQTLEQRASSEIIQPNPDSNLYQLNHQVESYMNNKGGRFVQRFDANTYLRVMEAWQRFDLAKENGCGSIVEALRKCRHQKYMVFSIDSDVCFYPDEQLDMVQQLKEADVPCRYLTVHSDKGHDSFLLEPELFTPYLAYMLEHDWEFGK